MSWFNKQTHHDSDFMSEVSAATVESTHIGGHILLAIAVLFFIIAIWWAQATELDEVTRGDGKVVPSSKVQIIQNLEGGILAEVLVKEGEAVQQDQVLLKIDDTRFSSSFRETELKYYELLAKSSRLEAESEKKVLSLPAELTEKQPVIAADEKALYQSRQLE